MGDNHGDFVWYELATKDVEAAKAFYGPLLDWTFEVGGQPDMPYHMFFKDGVGIGGIMTLTGEMLANGAHPVWAGYVHVADVEKATAKAKSLGATIYIEPTDIPDIGCWSLIADPQGASLYLMQGYDEQTSQSFAKYEPRLGHCAWNELAARDPSSAIKFYQEMFEWAPEQTVDMGSLGSYHMLRQDDYVPAGVYQMIPDDPQPHWMYYFRVADLDAAQSRIHELGGSIHIDPVEIPGGEHSLVGTDPEGTHFGLVGPKGG